jgi:hypothetical protein
MGGVPVGRSKGVADLDVAAMLRFRHGAEQLTFWRRWRRSLRR